MAIKLGNNDISFKVGNSDVDAIYLGSTLVYSGGTPPTPSSPKWIATYSDSHTESAACDSTSAITRGELYRPGNIVSIEIGDCVTNIGDNTFYYCGSLTSCTIGSGVTSIGNYAFEGCSSLTSCTIGSGVTSIGDDAFADCSSLSSITVEATTPPTLLDYGVFDSTNECPIYVPIWSVDVYRSTWFQYSYRIQGFLPS